MRKTRCRDQQEFSELMYVSHLSPGFLSGVPGAILGRRVYKANACAVKYRKAAPKSALTIDVLVAF